MFFGCQKVNKLADGLIKGSPRLGQGQDVQVPGDSSNFQALLVESPQPGGQGMPTESSSPDVLPHCSCRW